MVRVIFIIFISYQINDTKKQQQITLNTHTDRHTYTRTNNTQRNIKQTTNKTTITKTLKKKITPKKNGQTQQTYKT